MSGGHPPAFQFYPKDWISDQRVRLMTPEQRGATWHLVCSCWVYPDFSLPDDDDQLAHLAGLSRERWNECSTLVRSYFIPHPSVPQRITVEWLLREREKQIDTRKKKQAAGRRSGEVRRKVSNRRSTHVQRNGAKHVHPLFNIASPSASAPSPSSPPQHSVTWQEVEEALHQREVVAGAEACKNASDRGVKPTEALAIIAHYDALRGAWGPGALQKRISIARPGDDPSMHWPTVSVDYTKRKRSMSIDRQSLELQRQREEAERDRARREDLERRVGPELDALPADELERLAEACVPAFLRSIYRSSGRSSPTVREYLLEALETEQLRRGEERNGN